jgi:AcrR family transcriptional regulator
MTDQSVLHEDVLALGKGDKRAAIMRAAERLFHNRRFHEVTLDEVAVAAHVGKGTIYRYFADKDDLFFQVATAGFEDLCVRVEECAAASCSMRERLLHIVQAVCGYFDERIEMFAIIHAESAWMPEGRGGVRERWQKVRVRLPQIVRQGLRGRHGRQRDSQ